MHPTTPTRQIPVTKQSPDQSPPSRTCFAVVMNPL